MACARRSPSKVSGQGRRSSGMRPASLFAAFAPEQRGQWGAANRPEKGEARWRVRGYTLSRASRRPGWRCDCFPLFLGLAVSDRLASGGRAGSTRRGQRAGKCPPDDGTWAVTVERDDSLCQRTRERKRRSGSRQTAMPKPWVPRRIEFNRCLCRDRGRGERSPVPRIERPPKIPNAVAEPAGLGNWEDSTQSKSKQPRAGRARSVADGKSKLACLDRLSYFLAFRKRLFLRPAAVIIPPAFVTESRQNCPRWAVLRWAARRGCLLTTRRRVVTEEQSVWSPSLL